MNVRVTQGGEHSHFGRSDDIPNVEGHLSFPHVFSLQSDMAGLARVRQDGYLVFLPVGVFHHNHGIRIRRDKSSCEDPDRFSGPHRSNKRPPRRRFADKLEFCGRGRVSTPYVFVPTCVSVHRRVIAGWYVPFGLNVFRQDSSQGFEDVNPKETGEIAYVHLTGGDPAGEKKTLDVPVMELAEKHFAELRKLLSAYAAQAQPYYPRAMMEKDEDEGDYDHLSRFREWTLSGDVR